MSLSPGRRFGGRSSIQIGRESSRKRRVVYSETSAGRSSDSIDVEFGSRARRGLLRAKGSKPQATPARASKLATARLTRRRLIQTALKTVNKSAEVIASPH